MLNSEEPSLQGPVLSFLVFLSMEASKRFCIFWYLLAKVHKGPCCPYTVDIATVIVLNC